jgi:hypothetical protein
MKVTHKEASTYLCLMVRRKDEEKNWTVKHNLCYWISNEPRITTEFYKLQCTLKFFDNQSITDTYLWIYALILSVGIIHGLALIQSMYTKVFKTTCKCFKNTALVGTNVRSRVFNAGLLARSQFASRKSCDRPTRSRLQWLSLVLEEMLSW